MTWSGVSRNYIDYRSFKECTRDFSSILLICPHKMEGQLRTLAADPGGIHDAAATAGSVLSGYSKETSPWLTRYPIEGLREHSTWPDPVCSSVLWTRPSSGIRREQRNHTLSL